MTNIYTIELTDTSDLYNVSTRIYENCFNSYDSAKEFLLKYFECQSDNQGEEYFILKEDAPHNSEFSYDDTATIQVLNLVAPKVKVFDKMVDNLKDKNFMHRVSKSLGCEENLTIRYIYRSDLLMDSVSEFTNDSLEFIVAKLIVEGYSRVTDTTYIRKESDSNFEKVEIHLNV